MDHKLSLTLLKYEKDIFDKVIISWKYPKVSYVITELHWQADCICVNIKSFQLNDKRIIENNVIDINNMHNLEDIKWLIRLSFIMLKSVRLVSLDPRHYIFLVRFLFSGFAIL